MHRLTKALFSLFLLLGPLSLMAHEGHGTGAGHELWHYLSSPAHIIPAAVVLAVTVALLLFRRRRKTAEERPR